MSTLAPTATVPSLGAFLAADPRRDLRTEVSVGDWWLGDGFPPPAWRAAWVPATGEVYVQRLGALRPGGEVTVVAQVGSFAELEALLEGWEDVCGTADSARWLFDRLWAPVDELPAAA